METVAKTFVIAAKQNQFNQENLTDNPSVRRIANAMNTNTAFTGSYTENQIWYQNFDLRQTRKLSGGQVIVNREAADKCPQDNTITKAKNVQDYIASVPNDNFKDYYVLVFDLTSVQNAF